MKKMLAWMLSCCMLFSCFGAQALTMEQAVLGQLPQVLAKAADGFELLVNTQDVQSSLRLTCDENGSPLLMLANGGETVAIRFETMAEALLCHLTGADPLPEGEAADFGFVTEMAAELGKAVQSAIVFETQSQPQADGSAVQNIHLTVSPKKLLTEADSTMQALLTQHAQSINHVLTRYASLIAKTGAPIPSSADQLLSYWRSLNLSDKMLVEMPFDMQITAAATPFDPWTLEAKAAGIRLTAENTGEYVTAVLSTWQEKFTFDSRDFVKLGDIVQSAWESAAQDTLCLTHDGSSAYVKFNALLLVREFFDALVPAIYQHEQTAKDLVTRYAPWFGTAETDPDVLLRELCISLRQLTIPRFVMALPVLEAQARQNGSTFTLRAALNGMDLHIHISPEVVDISLPGLVRFSGLLTKDAFTANCAIAYAGNFSASGRCENGRWTVDLHENNRLLAQLTADQTSAQLAIADALGTTYNLLWGESSLQLTSTDGVQLTLLKQANELTCSFENGFDFGCSGRAAWGGSFALDVELHRSSRSRYSSSMTIGRLKAAFSDGEASVEYHNGSDKNIFTSIYKAVVNWKQPHLHLSLREDAPLYGYTADRFLLDYRPGHVKIQPGSRLLQFLDTGAAADANHQMTVIREKGYHYLLEMWDVVTAFDEGQCRITVTGDDALEVTFAAPAAPATAEELQNAVISVKDLMLRLGWLIPTVEAPVSTQELPAPKPEGPVLSGTADGFAGPVSVQVTLNGNQITSIVIGDEQFTETPGFGAKALEDAFQSQFIGKTLPLSLDDIDAIAGASITTEAVVEAINSVVK